MNDNCDIILSGDSWTYLWHDNLLPFKLAEQLDCIHFESEGLQSEFLSILLSGIGKHTINIGIPGADNNTAITVLKSSLEKYTPKFVIYFFTESIRSQTDYNKKEFADLYNASTRSKAEVFKLLDIYNNRDALLLADTFIETAPDNSHCLILGGHEYFDENFLTSIRSKYPEHSDRFHLVTPSIWQLLSEHSTNNFVETPPHFGHNFIDIIDENADEEFVDYLLSLEDIRDRKMSESIFVQPDGGHHPNAVGQFIVFNEILKCLNNLEKEFIDDK